MSEGYQRRNRGRTGGESVGWFVDFVLIFMSFQEIAERKRKFGIMVEINAPYLKYIMKISQKPLILSTRATHRVTEIIVKQLT